LISNLLSNLVPNFVSSLISNLVLNEFYIEFGIVFGIEFVIEFDTIDSAPERPTLRFFWCLSELRQCELKFTKKRFSLTLHNKT